MRSPLLLKHASHQALVLPLMLFVVVSDYAR
jgi:hypothetical protein